LPKAKDARADKAFEMYKQGLKLIEIANQLGIAEGTVRSWKNRYKWDDGGNATLQKKEKKERNVAKKIATQTNDASWVEIEHEYVTDISRKPCSLEDLARKYSIPIQTIKDQSATGKWSDKRAEYKLKTNQKLIEKSSDADADRIVRLLSIADKAAEKAEQALGELEQYVVRDKKKVKTVEYKDNTAIGKPTKEIIDETERINIASGPIDRLGLSQVTGALKNLKEIYMIPAALEKQSAETALLKAKVQTDDEEETADDGFLEALQGSAAEDWMDEEN
jgi:phage terminase small subunit